MNYYNNPIIQRQYNTNYLVPRLNGAYLFKQFTAIPCTFGSSKTSGELLSTSLRFNEFFHLFFSMVRRGQFKTAYTEINSGSRDLEEAAAQFRKRFKVVLVFMTPIIPLNKGDYSCTSSEFFSPGIEWSCLRYFVSGLVVACSFVFMCFMNSMCFRNGWFINRRLLIKVQLSHPANTQLLCHVDLKSPPIFWVSNLEFFILVFGCFY